MNVVGEFRDIQSPRHTVALERLRRVLKSDACRDNNNKQIIN